MSLTGDGASNSCSGSGNDRGGIDVTLWTFDLMEYNDMT